MKTYKLQTYGWETEITAHRLNKDQLDSINKLMRKTNSTEFQDIRDDMESEGIIHDIYNPDLFHGSYPYYTEKTYFVILDENDKEVLEFTLSDINNIDEIRSESDILILPGLIEEGSNILFTLDESKGGLQEYHFESDKLPKVEDFSYELSNIITPDFDLEVISNVLFKKQTLEVYDYLDNRGKSSSTYIF